MSNTEIIGNMKGVTVMIDRDTRSVILAHQDMPPLKFSIDHPYIQGTTLEKNARLALTNKTKAERIAAALLWLPLEADCDDGLEDILNQEQCHTLKGRIVSALLTPDVYDMPIARS